ncbi:MAG TPA: DUF1667 domain-containing protein [Candidatus Omnitrophota bacterium]|nr:DUF1667 domain-containing protein [Candidatus Omnitrophota bacterium]HQJ15601.1 DUF1667 domain-containing protein [Candidatus Omnitrophota bacterium]
MKKEMICIECPKGCRMEVYYGDGKTVEVNGNMCPRGREYAASEIEDPRRILTSSVLCEGLDLRMLPVRTDKPIPKQALLQAMERIRKIRVKEPVRAGDVIAQDFFGANLIATRSATRENV